MASVSEGIEWRIFIDESGEREYGDRTSRYFVYAGCVVAWKDIEEIEIEIKRIKQAYFGISSVEFKSNWFRIPKERKKHYLEPYHMTDTLFREMTREVFRVLKESRVILLASVIDKSAMQEKYGHKAFSPSGWAYELLMERYQFMLAEKNSFGDAIMDDISGCNPKGHKYKILLKQLHKRLQQHGTSVQKIKIDRVKGVLGFLFSQTSNFIQLADLAAYNVLRQYREHGECWEPSNAQSSKIYAPFANIAEKFRASRDGKIQGFGITKFPE
jgi:hypothetical protein